MGHSVPAAQAGGGRGVPAAAGGPILPRVCRLHLPVVSEPVAMWRSGVNGAAFASAVLDLNMFVKNM